MVSKVGFDFDEFGGNVDVVIVKGDRVQLANSDYLMSLQGDWRFDQQQSQAWSFYNGVTYPAEGVEALAKELSKEFSTKTIYFYFGDASGWMGYKLFVNGEESVEKIVAWFLVGTFRYATTYAIGKNIGLFRFGYAKLSLKVERQQTS